MGILTEYQDEAADLIERLREASRTLLAMSNEASTKGRVDHLRSKAEGVRLALSYLDEARRQGRL